MKYLRPYLSLFIALCIAFAPQAALANLRAVSGVAVSVSSAAFPLQGPSDSASAPNYSWSGSTNTGVFRRTSPEGIGFSISGTTQGGFTSNNSEFQLASGSSLTWSSGIFGASSDVMLQRGAANVLSQLNSTNAQSHRLYFSTTGPVYWMDTARTAGVLYTATGGAAQVSYAQTTVPTCSTNCGTSPSVVGTDTAGTITMGATGSPASGWVLTFNGTWPAAPSCMVAMALTGMANTKLPLTIVTTTTTMTVVTNGAAPANADKYHYHCYGVS